MALLQVAASTFARGYLDGVVSGVFGQLQARGFFYDPVEREVQQQLLPWLREQAQEQLASGIIARRVGGTAQRSVPAALARVAAVACATRSACLQHVSGT